MADLKILHLSISLEINEDTRYSYQNPRVQKDFNFSIPVELFNTQSFSKLVEKVTSELSKEFEAKLKESENREEE